MSKLEQMGQGVSEAAGKPAAERSSKTMDSTVLLKQEQEQFTKLQGLSQLLQVLVGDLPQDFKEKYPMQYKRANFRAAQLIQRASALGSAAGIGGVVMGVASMNSATMLEGAVFGVGSWLAGFLHERPKLRSADEVHHFIEGPASEAQSRKEARFNTDPNKW